MFENELKVNISRYFAPPSQSATNPSTPITQPAVQPTTTAPPIAGLESVIRIIQSILTAPYAQYLQRSKSNEIDLELKKLYSTIIVAEAT